MQWDASQREDAPLIGAEGRRTICFCMHLPTWGSDSLREWSQWFFRRLVKSIPFWSCFSAAFQFSFSSLFVKCSSGFQALNRCEDKCSNTFWTSIREKIWLWNSRHLRWLKHCFEMLGGQNSCFHVCSWIGQTTGTIWTRLWWPNFSQSLARLLHGQQNGEAKGFPHIVNCWLKSAAEP